MIPGAGYAAGVPDKQTAGAQGWDYDKLCSFFGPDSEGEHGDVTRRMGTAPIDAAAAVQHADGRGDDLGIVRIK